MASVERLPVLYHDADYIIISFEIVEPILVINRIPHSLVVVGVGWGKVGGGRGGVGWRIQPRNILLYMKSLNKTGSQIFVLLLSSLFPKAIF